MERDNKNTHPEILHGTDVKVKLIRRVLVVLPDADTVILPHLTGCLQQKPEF